MGHREGKGGEWDIEKGREEDVRSEHGARHRSTHVDLCVDSRIYAYHTLLDVKYLVLIRTARLKYIQVSIIPISLGLSIQYHQSIPYSR